MEVEDEQPIESTDIEYELDHLKNFDNEKQLKLLRQEAIHITTHNIIPQEGWYDDRFEYIYKYSQVDWLEIAKTYHNRNQFLHDTSICIARLLEELMDERCTEPNFNLASYCAMLHNIMNLWNYYKEVYLTEDDDDILELINGISGL
jgi:hypothetical protein